MASHLEASSYRLGKIEHLRRRREQAVTELLQGIDRARQQYDRTIKQIDDQTSALEGMRRQVLVLVRRSPGIPPKYHDSDRPCGKVPAVRRHYETMLLGEAKAQDIGPCSHCGRRLG